MRINPRYTTICKECGRRIDLLRVDSASYWQSLPECCAQHITGKPTHTHTVERIAGGRILHGAKIA